MRDVGPAPQEPQAPTPAQPVPPEIAARRRGRTSTSEDEAQSFYQSQGRPMPSAVGVDPTEPPVFTDDGRPPSVTVHDFSPEVQSSREQATSDMAAEEQARLDAAGHDKAQTAFEAASQAYPHLRAEYDAKLAAAKGEQPYTIRFGANDPGVEVNPAALRYGARHAAAEDFAASIRGLNLDERGKANAAAALAALEYGRSKEQVYAQFDRAQATGQKFEDATALQSQRDAAALERAKIAGPRNPGDFHVGQLHEQQEAGTIRDQNFFLNSFKDWEQKAAQIPLQGKSYPRLTQALKNINSGNPALQRDAQSQLVSYFSGGGVVREFEQKFLLSHLAGLGAQGETAIEHLKTGRLGPQDLAVMQQATHMALQEQRQRAEELYDAAKGGYGPGTGFDYFGGNVDAKVRATLRAIGFDPPPMYPGVEPVQIGDIARPYRSQLGRTGSAPPAARPRRGAPPEVDARIRGKSASDLDSAMQ
jgi:hypothetical protein